jgi:glycosyltransferase involved in cell wall biosynthesis
VQNRLPLSVAVITLNEEKNLARCLESVRGLASEIVVVDSGSTDGTGDIAKSFGAQFTFEKWQGHVAQKNLALGKCSQPWVLCLDADEEVSPELAASIQARFNTGEPVENGCEVNRRTFYLGQWIWHAWYPEWRVRLVRKSSARWVGRDPHDALEVSATTGRLAGDLLHYSYKDLNDHLHKTLKYARLSAREMQRAGKVPRFSNLLFSPALAFLKKLLFKQAWRDGWRGWLIAYSAFLGVFAKYAYMFEEKSNVERNETATTSEKESNQR